ncbi:kinase-like domain-containing protein [Cyathus striatus]|nr:kinase-like domain-containing protein [Cyathus striatus]
MPPSSTQGVYLFENRSYPSGDHLALRRIRDIAMVLHNVDQSMAILPCTGFHPIPGSSVCELVFSIPDGMHRPRTLRDILIAPENSQGIRHSLSTRISLAIRIATAVLYIHTAKLVHKNIRPENIVIFERVDAGPREVFPFHLGTAYLMGFDFARKEDEASSRTGDDEWNKNLYRHPERYGIHPEANFNMLHDIYNLGVVLLEIALWRSFVVSKRDDEHHMIQYLPNPQACKFTDKTTGKLKSPKNIQEMLIRRAEEYIPLVLGDKYKDVVVMCLTGLEGGFGDVEMLKDHDGVVVGLVFMRKVLGLLEEISL